MSNFSIEGLQTALGSPNAQTRNNALKVLAEWLRSSDPEKQTWAARISAESLESSVKKQDQAMTEARINQIYQTFFAAHPELIDCQANRVALEAHINGPFDLDVLEQLAEQIKDQLSTQKVPDAPLSDADRLQAKLRAIRERNAWLKTLSQEELRGLARQEAEDRKRGRDPLAPMRLNAEEQTIVDNQPKPSRTAVRLWVPNSNPQREFTSLELRKMNAEYFRAVIGDGGGRTSPDKLARVNEILAGAQPEGVTA
jgi:hypothetical protein